MPGFPPEIDLGTAQDWAQVTDAYGPSTGTPDDLRRLYDPDPAVRGKARWTLYGSLYHQGGRFPATVKAAPILLRMLEDPSCPERAFLLEYIANICFGFPEEHHPFGVAPDRHRALLEREARGTPMDGHARVEPGCDPGIALALFDFYRVEGRRLLPFLVDADPAVRLAAVYPVAHLLADDAGARAMLARRIEVDLPPVRQSAMLGLTLMERAMGLSDRVALLRPLLGAEDPRDRFLAAMGLIGEDDNAAVALELLAGLADWTDPEDLPGLSSPIGATWDRTWGDPRGQATLLIARLVPEPTEAWVEALGTALPMPDIDGALDAVAALLRMVTPVREGGFRDVAPADLTPLQRRALDLLRDRGIWTLGDGGQFLNMQSLVASFGLPRTREALADWLKG